MKFQSLAQDSSFNSCHTLKQSGSNESAGRDITFPTSGEQKGRGHILLSETPSKKFLFVFHEWWGLNQHIKNEGNKYFSELNNVNVLCVDLYDGKVAQTREEASELMQSSNENRIKEIITGAISFAGPEAQICTIGWCFGGTWSLQASMMMNEHAFGCVMYYGMPEKEISKLEQISFNTLGIFATQDQWITPEIVTDFEKNMKSLNKRIEIVSFDAQHAFANPSNEKYDQESGNEAYFLSLEFLNGMFEVED